MNLSEPFVRRPVATTLLTIGIALTGFAAYFHLAVSPMPQVDFPTITVTAAMPGASPDTMAASVATPLERHLGQIADVTEMTSVSSIGSSQITLQFGLDRELDGAARDVQAAINASRADLPSALRSNPTYRKVNPADLPILILTLTSDTLTSGQLYDIAATVLQQRLSQVPGVGDVTLAGSSLPAVRVELNPAVLFKYGLGAEDVRAALSAANANSPKGAIESDREHWQIYSNDQAVAAREYRSLVVAYRNGAAVRLGDVAEVTDSVEDIRNLGISDGRTAVLVQITRQPGANIIATGDRVRALLPELRASIPAAATLAQTVDRTTPIRASIRDVEVSLLMSVVLVILVVFVFLRDWRATLIPCVAVPVSLIGAFAAMYLLDYSLDNLSLMALTIATGFVVDDAFVVMENIVRHMEAGVPRLQAALLGVRQVGFTVFSMSLSLIAVFIPILLMGGIVGRLFREFAVTLAVAILISMVISLTATPMMCAYLLGARGGAEHGRLYRATEHLFDRLLRRYELSLDWALRHGRLMLAVLAVTVGLNLVLFWRIPKGFFPEQDTGRLVGTIQADQSISFQRLSLKLRQYLDILQRDPDVQAAVGQTGGNGGTNVGRVYMGLKPLGVRKSSSAQVIARLRPKLAAVPGATLILNPGQEIRIGGRQSSATYQYTLQAVDLEALRAWTPRLLAALKAEPILTDLNSDQQDKGLQLGVVVDHDLASQLGLTSTQVDNALYDAFGQRQVSTIYKSLNQYHVVMVVAPRFWADPATLREMYVSTAGGAPRGTSLTNAVAGTVTAASGPVRAGRVNRTAGANDAAGNSRSNAIAATGKTAASAGQAVSTGREVMVPLAAFARYEVGTTPLVVNHHGQFAAATISFNLAGDASLGDAVRAIDRQVARIHMPGTIRGSFQGTARTYEESIRGEPVLVGAAMIAIYLVLGVLYESYLHPCTILSTIPSAGLGAVLALLLFHTEFSLIALIGLILLIGIVKKNAIMMIDFAIEAERRDGLSARDAIFQAGCLRFRPILMTTAAAMLGALPLAVGYGDGAELRRPLGIAIVGGLVVSQLLTLYTTPVVYVYLDRVRAWWRRRAGSAAAVPGPGAALGGWRWFACALAWGAVSGCASGPDYRRPAVAAPPAFKEAAGWKAAAPGDVSVPAAWWEVLHDPLLNTLEEKLAGSNLTVARAEADYEQARQVARAERTALWPTLSGSASAQRAQAPGTTGVKAPADLYDASLAAAWPVDLWGKTGRTGESAVALAQAEAAFVAATRLAQEAALAQDYVQLRVADELARLLGDAVTAFRRTLEISQNRYAVGVAARSDLISARAQLDGERARRLDAEIQRAQLEHAIAILVATAPADFAVPPRGDLGLAVPAIPGGLPSELLERRPDIAQAEREVAAANATIGVQTAVYFPQLTLGADGGFEGSRLRSLLTTPFRFWSLGAQAGETLLDWGQRHDQVLAARAAYDASVTGYRATVLAAFQQVEDGLASLRILGDEDEIEAAAVREAAEAARIALNEYGSGTVDYTTVVTAQVTELTSREAALAILQNRFLSSVAFMAALGGGWNSGELATPRQVLAAGRNRAPERPDSAEVALLVLQKSAAVNSSPP